MNIRIGIFLFEEAEALDFAGPYEVFTTASRVAHKSGLTPTTTFTVFSVAQTAEPVRLRAGMQVIPDFTLQRAQPVDVLIIPGGVVTAEMQKTQVIAWIKNTAAQASITASVCTGAFLLAQSGVLLHHRATTHWEDIVDLRLQFPGLTVLENVRWVDEGNVVTSAGISAGIDMSLHLVARLADRALAIATARQMEFDWRLS